MKARNFAFVAGLAQALCLGRCLAQQPLSVDTTFRIHAEEDGVISIIPLPDGKVIVSGGILFPGSSNLTYLARLNEVGGRDVSFFESGFGGGKLTLWNDRFYSERVSTIRRVMLDGHVDTSFIEMNSDPYFSSLQGGDFHVFQDGRLLMCGTHFLDDTLRGFIGPYNLIWFSNSGYLDTTRTHRRCNGSTRQIEPMNNGQFLVSGIVSECEGHSVGRIFRINADGSVDPSLQSGVDWGAIYSFLPLDDGRFYASGIFSKADAPNDTLRLVRFLPDGSLDPTFDNHIPFSLGVTSGPFGALPSPIQSWNNGSILVMGTFQFVDGQPRRGICVIDSTGQLMDEFDGCGVGPYVDQGWTHGTVTGCTPNDEGDLYIHGYYHGYNDGSTNDTLQRFVTRLFGPDFTTEVSERPATETFAPYPNPTAGAVSFTYSPSKTGTRVVVQDIVGRVAQERNFPANTEQLELDLGGLAQGTYLLRLLQGERTLGVRQVVVQR